MSDGTRLNCWEVMGCGREPGGDSVADLGVCPTTSARALDGVHGGTNGGRSCWVVAGTLCKTGMTGSFAKNGGCMRCDFYKRVVDEEMVPEYRSGFHFTTQLLRKLEDRTE